MIKVARPYYDPIHEEKRGTLANAPIWNTLSIFVAFQTPGYKSIVIFPICFESEDTKDAKVKEFWFGTLGQ